MKKIIVRLKEKSYPLIIAPLAGSFSRELKKLSSSHHFHVLIVTSSRLKKAGHLSQLTRILKKAGLCIEVIIIPDGEKNKNFKTLTSLYGKALSAGVDRTGLVIALGGGVITDLAGFFAATYMRGIRYVSIPTTLLAMVDASIGGKTGVDLPEGKNLAGSFWQPSLVWIDPAFLKTLPDREWKTGMAEVVKYGVILDKKFFEWIEEKVRRKPNVQTWSTVDLEKAIFVSAKTKAAVVSADERETPLKGGREVLNFGHTIGHALEAATDYRSLTHGEAISIGMVAAGQMSLHLGSWNKDAQLRLMSLFDAIGLPIQSPRLTKTQQARFWMALRKDKKNVSGKLRFVLPKKIGSVVVQSGITPALVKSVL